ncbi:MAG: diguanylate cyclase [Acholeplasmataceae bacterium]|nr:diguanylate cyclase [Acholeplasmataceae bacterium]
MSFLEGFLLIASMLMLLVMALYAVQNTHAPGAVDFFALMMFSFVWSGASFMEELQTTYSGLLLWRNIGQLGVFGTPLIILFFSIRYTRRTKLLSYAYVVMLIQVISVGLIFTDSIHHLMRDTITMIHSEVYGPTLIVTSTPLGLGLVTFNFMLAIGAVIVIFDTMRHLEGEARKKLGYVNLSIFLVFIAALVKMALLTDMGIHVSISVLFIPGALLLFVVMFKYDILNFSPIGRDVVFNHIDQGIVITDAAGIITDLNDLATKWLNAYIGMPSKLIGLSVNDLIDSVDDDINVETVQENTSFELHFTNLDPKCLRIERYPMIEKNGQHRGTVVIMSDITDQKDLQKSLQYLAKHDSLTMTLNRHAFEQLYQSINENGPPLIAMIMLDVDGFRAINNTHGHVFGDTVLRRLSETIRSLLPEKAHIGRLGGDEFGIILENRSKEDALTYAETIRQSVSSLGLTVSDARPVSVSISLGITDNDGLIVSFDKLRNTADIALYKAKEQGKNTSVVTSFQR